MSKIKRMKRWRWRVSWEVIITPDAGEPHLLYRTYFFRSNQEPKAMDFFKKKLTDPGARNIKLRRVRA